MLNKVIVVAGPTASGKTALAVRLAHEFYGEVVSADSMQIYKYMNIGTAKPTESEMEGIPHHLIDIVSPLEEFNVVKYQSMAKECIDDILKRDKIPIICGGTGLYINSLIYNISYAETSADSEFRRKLREDAEKYGSEHLYDRLKEVDPETAANIHSNNVKRVIRAIEVYEHTGKRFSECIEESMNEKSPYDFIFIYLDIEREYLYERINQRVGAMIENGLIEESLFLYKNGLLEGQTASMGICYKELLPYVIKKIEGVDDPGLLEECTDRLRQVTRNYAKRQITWFNRIKNIDVIRVHKDYSFDKIIKKVKEKYESLI